MEMETDTVVVPPQRWSHIRKLLERPGPFCRPDFEPSTSNLVSLMDEWRVLVVGAGGLGCELLKNLVLLGFHNVHVIDMDIIDISNLNRQLLFRMEDVGQYKAEVAAKFLNQRIQGAKVVPYCCKIQEKGDSFYKGFHVVVCGLDSIDARCWLNGMILSLVEYDNDGKLKLESVIPIIDGGTEGFKGNVRVIVPKTSPCIECTIDLYPPAVTYPLCTIATTPRLPDHCIEYARIILWDKEKPFKSSIDGDDAAHITWIYEKANERATQYGITGVTYRLTQGVIKNIIPAVASTNAVIAAACSTEVFKIATKCYLNLNNYMVFSDIKGIYTYSYEGERKENCSACSGTNAKLEFPLTVTLQEVIHHLVESRKYQMKLHGILANIDGKMKTLFMVNLDLTNENLRKPLTELGLKSGDEITVVDPTISPILVVEIVLKEDLKNECKNTKK